MKRSNRLKLKYLLAFEADGHAVGLFVALGPPKLLARSETPEFYASCHVMEVEVQHHFPPVGSGADELT